MEGAGSSHSETLASDRSTNVLNESQAHQESGGLHSDAHTRDKAADPPSEDSPREKAQSHQGESPHADGTGTQQSEGHSRRQETPPGSPTDNGPPMKNTEATAHRIPAKALHLHSAVRELNIKAAQPQSSASTATHTYRIALTELVPLEHLDSIFVTAPPNPSQAPAAPDIQKTVRHMRAMSAADLTALFTTITKTQTYLSNAKRSATSSRENRKRKVRNRDHSADKRLRHLVHVSMAHV
jgi:hypothetical protein